MVSARRNKRFRTAAAISSFLERYSERTLSRFFAGWQLLGAFGFPLLIWMVGFPVDPRGCIALIVLALLIAMSLVQNTAWLAYTAFRKSAEKDDPLRDKEVIISLSLISYFSVISFFAGVYYFISQGWPDAIHIAEPGADGRLSLVDSYYFSVVTAATVGYGDIYPVWALPKLLVIAEIAISFCYVVLLFSAVVGFVRESRDCEP